MNMRTLQSLLTVLLITVLVYASPVVAQKKQMKEVVQNSKEQVVNDLLHTRSVSATTNSISSNLDEINYYLNETFDNGIPENWLNVANETTTISWDTLRSLNYGSEALFVSETPPFAGIDSDAENDQDIDADLITPEITIPSNSFIDLFLQFDASFRTYQGDIISFYYTIDGGNNWVELYCLDSDYSRDNNSHYYDLLPIIGNEGGTIQFKWSYIANYDYHMAIDNVVMIGTDEDIRPPVITILDAPDEVLEGYDADFLLTVTDASGLASADLHYHKWDTVNDTLLVGGYSGTISLTTTNGDTMAGTIDGETVGYQAGDVVAFWFEAVDASPNSNSSRLPAIESVYYGFNVIADVEAPEVDPLLLPVFSFVGDDSNFEFEIIDALTDVSAARLYYVEFDTSTASYGPVPGSTVEEINMMPGTDGIFTATIPGADFEVGDFIGYYLVVSDTWTTVNTDTLPGASDGVPEYNFYEVLSIPEVFWDFEADQGSFESSDETVWQWGNPEGADAGGSSSGVSHPTPLAFSGNNVWATVIDGAYADNVDATLTTTDAWVLGSNAMLRFVNWYHTETWDGHNLQISTDLGETWTVLEPLEGYTDPNNEIQGLDNEDGWNGYNHDYWQLASFDLGAYADMLVMFRFRFGSDSSGKRYGAAIDDFMLFDIIDPGELEGYVTDSSTGDPVENASLTVYLPGTTTEVSRTETDEDGYYHLYLLSYTYDVTARAYGYLNSTINLVDIEENTTTTTDFSLTSGVEVCPLEIHVWGDMENTIPLDNIAVSIPELDTLMVTGPDGIVDAGTVPHQAYTIILTSIPTGLQGYHDVTFNGIEVTDRSVPLDLYMPEILPPQNLNGTNGDEFIELTWNPPADQFTPDELEAIPGRLEVLHEYYAGVLENGSDNDLKKLPQIKEEIFRLEQALLRYGNGSQLDELTDFQGYMIRVNGEIWNTQPIQECYATIPLPNGFEYTCEVAAEYGYDPDFRVWSNSVTLRPLPRTEYLFEEVEFDWVELNPDLGGPGFVVMDEGDDENSGFRDMGVFFNFFETNYTSIAIATNGWLSFTNGTSTTNSLTIPSYTQPNALLVPLFVDIDLEIASDDFKIWAYTDIENNLFIVQYYGMYYTTSTETYSFQVIINGNDNSVTYQYQSASQGWTVRDPIIGFENQDGTDGATYFNGFLEDSYAISFRPTSECWGSIEGTITDADSAQPLEGVYVYAEGVNGLDTPPVQSDADGSYLFPVLNRLVAPYSMTFVKTGYEMLVVEDVDWPSDDDYELVLDATLTSLSSDSPPVIVSVDSEHDDRFVVTLAAPGTYIDMMSASVDESSKKDLKDKKISKKAEKQVTTSSLDEIGDVLWYMLQYSTEETPWETYDIDGDTLFAPNGEFCDIPVILDSENENTYYYFQVSAWMTDPEGLVDSLQTQWVWDLTRYNMTPSAPPDFTAEVDSLEITLTVTPPASNVDGSELVDMALYKAWMEVEDDFVEVASSETPELVFSVDEAGLYNIRVTVEDEVPNVSAPTENKSIIAGVPTLETSFEEDQWNQFQVTEGDWEHGIPTSGPDAAFEGQNVWATNLDGNFEESTIAWLDLISPATVLTENAMIVYHHWCEYGETGSDGYNLSISTDSGDNFTVIEPVGGYPNENVTGLGENAAGFASSTDGWQEVIFILEDLADESILISFTHGSDGDGDVAYGTAIDNLKFYGIEYPENTTVTGTIKECNSGGDPIGNAEVWVEGFSEPLALSNEDGTFEVVVPPGMTDFIFVHDDYWTKILDDVFVPGGGMMNLGGIYMVYPEGDVTPDTVDITYNVDNVNEVQNGTFTLENIGCGPMEYSVSGLPIESNRSGTESMKKPSAGKPGLQQSGKNKSGPQIESDLDEMWDLIASFEDIDNLTGYPDNYGIGMLYNNFYISSYLVGVLSKFDYDGELRGQISFHTSMVGDEYDGFFGLGNDDDGYLYGGNDRGELFKFAPDMSEVENLGEISNGVIACAYDWDMGNLYVTDDEGSFFRVSPGGSQVTQLTVPPYTIGGLAYFPEDPDGFTVYAYVLTNPTSIVRYNSPFDQWENEEMTTLYDLEEGEMIGDFACGIRTESTDFMTLKQGIDHDLVDLWEGCIDPLSWYEIDPLEGTLMPGASQQFTVRIQIRENGPYHPDPGTMTYLYVAISGPHMDDLIVVVRIFWTSNVGFEDQLPTKYVLHQNYPNPFNPSTSIKFDLVEAQLVKLTVYNMLGQEVARLLDSQMEAGYHNVSFDASRLASGVYFYRLETPVYTKMKKMVMIK